MTTTQLAKLLRLMADRFDRMPEIEIAPNHVGIYNCPRTIIDERLNHRIIGDVLLADRGSIETSDQADSVTISLTDYDLEGNQIKFTTYLENYRCKQCQKPMDEHTSLKQSGGPMTLCPKGTESGDRDRHNLRTLAGLDRYLENRQ